ncbi:hypothetical protein AURDEDRAFT_159813 [Auricularia subglabra TFB-10046 SS5]|nr:hypothetical protein AURDEDRAFT_159813 [Auricularia subglabra TFB-10046 SS5]
MSERPKRQIRPPPREPVLVAHLASKVAGPTALSDSEDAASDNAKQVSAPFHDSDPEERWERYQRMREQDDVDEWAELRAYEQVMVSMSTPPPASFEQPPSANKKRRRKRKKSSSPPPAVSSDDEESSVVDTPKPKRKKSKRKKRSVSTESSGSEELVVKNISVVVPSVDKQASVGLVKLRLKATISFDDALDEIHSAIGCNEKIKPALTCCIGKMKPEENGYKLSNTGEWDGLVQEAIALHRSACAPNTRAAREAAQQLPTLTIVVPDSYIAALKMRRNKGTAGKKKPSVLDLDGDEGDVVGDANRWGLTPTETNISQQLYEARKCLRCKSGFCLHHKSLTAGQFSTWTSALANELPGVTLNTPPKTIKFAEFWPGERSGTQSKDRKRSNSPAAGPPPSPFAFAFVFATSSSLPSRQPVAPPHLSADAADPILPVPYAGRSTACLELFSRAIARDPAIQETAAFTDPRHPVLSEFFAALAAQPHLAHHDLPAYVHPLVSHGFYTTQALRTCCVHGGAKDLMAVVAELKRGTAEAILKAVKKHYTAPRQ